MMKYFVILLILIGFVGMSESFANTTPLSSLKHQLESGINIDELRCVQNKVLVLKQSDGSPACVKSETAERLIQRGWANDSGNTSDIKKQTDADFSDSILAQKITQSNNQFTLDFYKQISKEKNENIFFSSPSISTAFSILYEGAKGETATEIQDVFGFPTDDNERQVGFASFIDIMNQKNNDENTIQMSNALWLANGFTPLHEYVNTATTYYDSSIDTVNFVTDEGRLEINDWVKTKTQDRIEELLIPDSVTSLTKMVITNTIYFKGLWEYPFELENTYDSDFVVDTARTVTVPMMMYDNKMNLNHTSTEHMQMLQMPYKESFSMLVILPHNAEDMRFIEDSLTIDNLELWKSQMSDLRGINIHLPKFTFDTEYDLRETLPHMGMSLVFDSADLSGITGYTGLFVSKAIHKAFIEVNEIGTEATAATAINLNESGGSLFKADHPFIFLIQDDDTNDILFIGKVVDPTK
ncbi:MAG: serpin family protein [Nitrosopumilaceae archaeon]|nr:serpin family protein [Nitrosopumilaceae archaeon]